LAANFKVCPTAAAIAFMLSAISNCSGRKSCACAARRQRGFTLIELVIAVAILAIVAAAAIPIYEGYVKEARIAKSIQDMRQMALILDDLYQDGSPPATLAAVGLDSMIDPWGAPYRYLWLRGNPALGIDGQRRRDRSMNPVNSDYDLYSIGADGQTSVQFVAQKARDDVVRANDGDFFGLANDH
jgi:general secretion pathway protein G